MRHQQRESLSALPQGLTWGVELGLNSVSLDNGVTQFENYKDQEQHLDLPQEVSRKQQHLSVSEELTAT